MLKWNKLSQSVRVRDESQGNETKAFIFVLWLKFVFVSVHKEEEFRRKRKKNIPSQFILFSFLYPKNFPPPSISTSSAFSSLDSYLTHLDTYIRLFAEIFCDIVCRWCRHGDHGSGFNDRVWTWCKWHFSLWFFFIIKIESKQHRLCSWQMCIIRIKRCSL